MIVFTNKKKTVIHFSFFLQPFLAAPAGQTIKAAFGLLFKTGTAIYRYIQSLCRTEIPQSKMIIALSKSTAETVSPQVNTATGDNRG